MKLVSQSQWLMQVTHQEENSSRPAQAKSYQELISTNSWAWWCIYHPSYAGRINRRTTG
jgi:hypothetical protein